MSLGVEEVLAKIKPGLPGVEIDHEIFRPATFIELSIDNLTTALLIGCVLVILILGAFLWEWRVALISIIAIPLSLIAAGVVLYWQGATINTMVLAGFVIALGTVVDDAIIGIENIVRRLRQHRATGSTYSAGRIILDATIEVRSAIVYATLIEVAALIPVFFMEGLSGTFFKPLGVMFLAGVLIAPQLGQSLLPSFKGAGFSDALADQARDFIDDVMSTETASKNHEWTRIDTNRNLCSFVVPN